ncbi:MULTISPECIES: ABC transporter permease [Oceanospirillaceae]|uniref:ABC transporter permease n=1 Tax=Oceanobacter antarcticus TaxID=3133425 RepID=A0ABW8NFI3_9GAMM|tara:strand:- start:1402 stop:2328 length:927 start_codon:yes stop_codon:yes gene_type:complete
MDIDLITNILYAMVRTGTPLLIVALGELICEKSGVLNLGQEGMMLMGAVVGFVVALLSGSLILGFVLAIVAGILMSLIFAAITMELSANQVATGLALTIFGTGLSAFIGADFVGKPIEGLDPIFIPLLTDLPLIGRMIFGQDLIVYLSFVLFGGVYWFIKYSRPGLILKAVGENPHSANAIGLPVLKTRYLAIMFGGAMAGLAGSYLSLAYTPLWAENMSAGRGWIALALVVFASWKAERVLLGAWLFGLASILHLVFQGLGFAVSPNLLAILPYLATVVVLVILSSNQSRSRLVAPMSLGKAFYAKS